MGVIANAFVGTLVVSGTSPPELPSFVDPPASIVASFRSIRQPLEFAGSCLDLHPHPALEGRYSRLDKRFLDAMANAIGIWGEKAQALLYEDRPSPWQTCSSRRVSFALNRTEQALDAHAKAFASATVGIDRGLRVGALKLCRDRVESARYTTDRITQQLSLEIKLKPEFAPLLDKVTGRAIGRPIAIRLNKKMIAQPQINERISKGEFTISGPDATTLNGVHTALLQPC